MTLELYDGIVRHSRPTPAHRVSMPVRYVLVDACDVVGAVPVPGWPSGRVRRGDLLDGSDRPLDDAVRELTADRLGRRPTGPVRVLTQPRSLGWLFNPLTVHWCHGPDGTSLEALVLEVTNTPWHERHWYVLDGEEVVDGGATFAKEMHVSPFMPMDLAYRCRVTVPGEHLAVHLQLVHPDDDSVVFDASLVARRSAPGDWRTRAGVVVQTVRTSAGIYAHAAVLSRKGAHVHRHPGRRVPAGAPSPRRSA